MNAPGLQWRGTTSAPFPGYMLIGRGEDFANMLTSASGDIVDQIANEMCGKRKYEYKGKCQKLESFDAGVLEGEPDQPVVFDRTVHGPVTGYAERGKKRYVISYKRSSYGRDTVDQLFFRRLSTGQVTDPQSFFAAARLTPQTFNAFYMDHQNIAEYTTGDLPNRSKKVDPGLLANGNGKFDWKGLAPDSAHPQGVNPADGTIVNWNETAARGFAAADDEWGKNGSVNRVDLLTQAMQGLAQNGKWSPASLTAAMNAAATQDIRAARTVPVLARLLQGSKAPSAQAQGMLDQMVAWSQAGGSRLDVDLDGRIDHPGAASMDAAWPRIADALLRPVLKKQKTLDELDAMFNRFDHPSKTTSDNMFDGWHQYFDRDVRELLGEDVEQPFANEYCGGGERKQCRKDIWKAIADAGKQLQQSQGSPDPAAWHADANAERIRFGPIELTTMRYTNRPSGIQQILSFNGHRP
jgi:acyl-homoserine lactone acylase PvdQ